MGCGWCVCSNGERQTAEKHAPLLQVLQKVIYFTLFEVEKMASKETRKKTSAAPQERSRRRQRILFAALAVIIIASWLVTLVIH